MISLDLRFNLNGGNLDRSDLIKVQPLISGNISFPVRRNLTWNLFKPLKVTKKVNSFRQLQVAEAARQPLPLGRGARPVWPGRKWGESWSVRPVQQSDTVGPGRAGPGRAGPAYAATQWLGSVMTNPRRQTQRNEPSVLTQRAFTQGPSTPSTLSSHSLMSVHTTNICV